MTYNRKIMRLELSAENPVHGGYYYAELLLPAADYEIKDAMQKARAVGRENTVEVSILECDILPELQDIRLDTFSLDELNFFVKRLSSLPDEELPVFYAVTDEVFRAADNDGLVSIKDLINSTYGLDTVPIASGISGPEALGRFAIENGLLSDLDDIPESAIPFLNAEQIGRVQQKNDSGVFEGRLYIPTVHYDRPEIYDGVTLPDEESESSDFAIRLLVSGTPEHIKGDPVRTMRTRNKPALIFFCFLLSAAAVLAGANIYSELKERQKEKEDFAAVSQIAKPTVTAAQTESEPTEQPAAERNIQALITENADCIGWLSINGTNISYPVMYSPSEPQKYLRRNFYGKYSQSGVPFLDGRCDIRSTNLIIYGHNMKNGTMFSDLKRYVDRDFLNAHRTVKFETADGVQTFIVTEALKTNTSDAWYDRIDAEDGRHLILSTCYGSGKDGRLLIIAEE